MNSEASTIQARASAIDAAQGGTTAWVRQLGGAGYEGVEDMAATPDGGDVVVTHLGKTGPFGAAAASIGLVRLRADRSVAWSREFPVAGALVRSPRVAVSATGGVFLLLDVRCDATTCPDLGGGRPSGGDLALLARYSPSGAFVWERVVDAWSETPALAVDAGGGAALSVVRQGSGPDAGARLVRFRGDGALLWDRPAPAVGGDGVAPAPSALAFDPSGDLAVGDGLAFYSLDPAGKVRWARRLADPPQQGWVRLIGTTSAGVVVVVAQPTTTTNGAMSWAGTTYADGAAGFLAVAEADGSPRLGRNLEPDHALGDAAVDAAGQVAIVYQGIGGWLLERWNLAGDRLWERKFEGMAVGWSAVTIDPISHHVRAAGAFSGTIDLGTGAVTSRGDWDDIVLDVWP